MSIPGRDLECAPDSLDVVKQVTVRDDDALRFARRSTCVLQLADGLTVEVWRNPGLGPPGFDSSEIQGLTLNGETGDRAVKLRSSGQCHTRIRVRRDRHESP